ncbi:MAG TPA: DUF2071 domain-containing protein [Thermoanaerobaculia bacterium]|nr:DUF2071 domain-containing protein [Thermoanaerobaculia bacterium]
MKLTMTVRDCLYLNWALPVEVLPEPPAPLRYQLHSSEGRDWVFASALLFHQDAVRLAALPLIRVGYPQFNLRFYVLDREGTPSVLFRRMLMPGWVVPGVRLVSHQPAFGARLDFPRPTVDAGDGPWRWRVEHGGTLEVRAWRDMSAVSAGAGIGEGPRLGSWDDTVRYFQVRLRGYAQNADGRLRRIDVRKPSAVAVAWPLRAEVSGAQLLPDLFCLPSNGFAWPPLHSAWLSPEIPFAFELGLVPKEVAVRRSMPQPAAGRVAGAWRANAALRERRAWEETTEPREARRASC